MLSMVVNGLKGLEKWNLKGYQSREKRKEERCDGDEGNGGGGCGDDEDEELIGEATAMISYISLEMVLKLS